MPSSTTGRIRGCRIAQTLRYVDELLAAYVDNTSGLIDAVAGRDLVASYANAVGYVESTTDVTIPVTSGVPEIINPLLVGVTSVQSGWGVDGNNFFFPDHISFSPSTVIPAGYSKVAQFQCVATFTKPSGGTDDYRVSWVKNGVIIGIEHDMRFTLNATETVTLPDIFIQDISVVSDRFGVQVTGEATGDDLVLNAINLSVIDSILGSAP